MEKILITGARSGLMNRVIELLPNYYIYVTVKTERELERVKEKYKHKKNIFCIKLDITNEDDVNKIENLDIDILIANAAIGEGGSIVDMPFNRIRNNYEVNVFSNFQLIQKILKQMIKKDYGKIIVISSLASIIPLPFLGAYCSTKSSVSMLTMCLRKEMSLFSSKIKIKMIQPGFYHTGFNQLMFDKKDNYMNRDSYFSNMLDEINKKEGLIIRLLEKQKSNSITNKIVKAIKTNDNRFIYRAPLSQDLFSRIYGLFRW